MHHKLVLKIKEQQHQRQESSSSLDSCKELISQIKMLLKHLVEITKEFDESLLNDKKVQEQDSEDEKESDYDDHEVDEIVPKDQNSDLTSLLCAYSSFVNYDFEPRYLATPFSNYFSITDKTEFKPSDFYSTAFLSSLSGNSDKDSLEIEDFQPSNKRICTFHNSRNFSW